MKKQRSLITGLVILLFVMLITACGAENEGNLTGNAGNSAGKADHTGEEAAAVDTQHVVSTLKGDISIPTEPKRVIGLSVVYPELLYALGVVPIAIQNYHQDFPSYLKEPFKDTIKMGIAQTPNFEAILASNPDLIIAPSWWSDKDYDQLSKIAPTVLLPQRDDWRDELRDIAKVLGKVEQADEVIQDLQAKETEAKEKLDSLVGDETVMYMMIMAKEIVIYGENIDRGSFIHKKLGLKPIDDYPQSELSISISLEKIPEYNPDHIILQLDDESNEEVQNRYEEMRDSSLWKNMTAVKKDQIHIMGGKEWFSLGMSPLADLHAIEDVLDAFEK
ncbi:ABC transporter substrate-binding protein [Paenibacillus nasutitermitis]|uniref:Ferrichrome ABC transporter substrate-binding protein n=1 Tax=Paenibacillus nasutitermitis TaxID=1652958 RepID=A0A916YQT7_9BACL|nr:ABC transporter substrate-binding protein [Paenibacillus nasutitermitis]GGD55593.1 ferrichrome ABC transporter substrate-binding protein [Paenibacillus nasutitermitis]